MYDYKDVLLSEILECGSCDLELLADVGYDLAEIVEECRDYYETTEINDMMKTVFHRGLVEMQDSIDSRIEELQLREAEDDLDEDELDELYGLVFLNLDEDTESYHNYLDTHIWITDEDKEELYKAYASEELEQFEKNTGFSLLR